VQDELAQAGATPNIHSASAFVNVLACQLQAADVVELRDRRLSVLGLNHFGSP
jgi:hypothetical protein